MLAHRSVGLSCHGRAHMPSYLVPFHSLPRLLFLLLPAPSCWSSSFSKTVLFCVFMSHKYSIILPFYPACSLKISSSPLTAPSFLHVCTLMHTDLNIDSAQEANMWCLYFGVWLISCNKMIFSSIHFPEKSWFHFSSWLKSFIWIILKWSQGDGSGGEICCCESIRTWVQVLRST